jgi:hypothetical protein
LLLDEGFVKLEDDSDRQKDTSSCTNSTHEISNDGEGSNTLKLGKTRKSKDGPILAFLIHQRFSAQERVPVVAETNSDIEKVLEEDGDSNALKSAKRIIPLADTPETFGPYARTLPSSVSLPMCWKRNELALFERLQSSFV